MVFFELLFVGLLFLTVFGLIGLLVAIVTRHALIISQIGKVLGFSWVAYIAALLIVGAATPQPVFGMNEDACFAQMCFAATNVLRTGSGVTVTIRASNRSRGQTQAEGGIRARLLAAGQYYAAVKSGDLAQSLKAGASAQIQLVFDLPLETKPDGLVLDHQFTLRYFVIGESPLLHKPALIRIG